MLRVSAPVLLLAVLLGITLMTEGCNDLTGTPGLPAGTPNPAFYNNATGALGMRNAAVLQVEQALPQYILDAGLLTDELEDANTGASAGLTQFLQSTDQVDSLDERFLPQGVTVKSYGYLQNIREFGNQAIGALATYDTTAVGQVLRGELYALEGYAEIMLADLFCSGVPLSNLLYQGNFQYEPSDSTSQVYQDAIAKFDTAITLAVTSDSVTNLARVGQGRANLDLGKYAEAADDVTNVPDGFQYQIAVDWFGGVGGVCPNFLNCSATESDREGINGLPYRSSGDPRTAAVGTTVNRNTGDSLFFPVKYRAGLSGTGYTPFTLASGVEARLIQAEAALQRGDAATWLADLNALRTSGSYTVTPDLITPTQQDTVWQAGSGGVSGLRPINDPGATNPVARVDTLFTERAAWLFLTGHRQGDLRRLLRQYSSQFESQQQVYPTGSYLAPGSGVYGTDVTAPIPMTEYANQYFHGCLSRSP